MQFLRIGGIAALSRVVRKVDNVLHRVNYYPVDAC